MTLSLAFGLIFPLFLAHLFPQATRGREYQISVQDRQGNTYELYAGSYALIIGNDKYLNGWQFLPGVADDIDEVVKVLGKHGFEITSYSNLDKQALLKAIEDFIDKNGSAPGNRLLFYYAGHGHTLTSKTSGVKTGYIVPIDAPDPVVDEAGFKSKAIDMQQFQLFCTRIESKHALFVFDSCFAGTIFSTERGAPEAISQYISYPVREFITSGDADEKVTDESIFRSQFVDGLEGKADLDGDGYITGTELGYFLNKNVADFSKGGQNPKFGKILIPQLSRGDLVFISGMGPKNPKGAAADLPPEAAGEIEFWRSVEKRNSTEAYETYLKKFPEGLYVELAKMNLKNLEAERNKDEAYKNYVNSARTDYQQGNYEKALENVRGAEAIKNSRELTNLKADINGKLLCQSARNHLDNKEYEAARKALEEAKKIKPSKEIDDLEIALKDALDAEKTAKLGKGKLRISADPPARIEVDGEPVPGTVPPVKFVEVSGGPHKIKFIFGDDDYIIKSESVNPNETKIVHCSKAEDKDLIVLNASYEISLYPKAAVYLDGAAKGDIPPQKMVRVTEGGHQLLFVFLDKNRAALNFKINDALEKFQKKKVHVACESLDLTVKENEELLRDIEGQTAGDVVIVKSGVPLGFELDDVPRGEALPGQDLKIPGPEKENYGIGLQFRKGSENSLTNVYLHKIREKRALKFTVQVDLMK